LIKVTQIIMTNNNPKGILLIFIGMFVVSFQDAAMKYIHTSVSLYEVYFMRTLISFIIIFCYLKITNKPIIFSTHYPLLTLIRVILFFFGFSSFYISLTIMPLATATALFFASPFLMTIFAIFILKEEVGLRRWLAVIIGFIGVYVILNPDFNNFNYLSLTPVFCAFCYALSMIIIKKTSDKDDVYSQMFHFYIFAITISLIIYFFIGDGQYNNFDYPASQFILRKWFSNLEFSLPYMIFIGVVGATGFLCFFTAYRVASPAVVSPFEYSILVWASLNGWIFFDEIPSQRAIVGMILIVSGSIYIFIREKIQDQPIVTEKPLR